MFALLFYFFTGHTLHATRGHFHSDGVVCWFAVFALMAALLLRGGADAWGRASGRLPRILLALGIADAALLLFYRPLLIHPRVADWHSPLIASIAGVLISATLALAHELAPRAGLARLSAIGLGLGAVGLIAARAVVPLISPRPGIDVFVFNSMACEILWSGHNPYAVHYPDIYQGKAPFSPFLPYPPGYLLCALPFRIGLGEIRLAHVFADMVSAAALFFIGRKSGISLRTSALLALAWLASPVALFVTEQSWIDPVLAMWAGLFFLAIVYRKWFFAGIALGVLCTVKQYGFIVGLGVLPWLAFQLPLRDLLKFGALAVVVALLIMAPFALADWPAFFRSVIVAPVALDFRPDSFSAGGFLAAQFEVTPPSFVSAALTLIAVVGGLVWLWSRRGGKLADAAGYVVLVYGVAFFFGKQAFCNYYQLLGYFVLLAVALRHLVPEVGRSQPESVESNPEVTQPATPVAL
jgi:hypothetical protein